MTWKTSAEHAGARVAPLVLRRLWQRREEARALARVARRAVRPHLEQQDVAVAVDLCGGDVQERAGRLALVPGRLAGAAVEVHLARLQRARQRVRVHVRDHQHLAGGLVLADRRHEALCVELYPGVLCGRHRVPPALAARQSSSAGISDRSLTTWSGGSSAPFSGGGVRPGVSCVRCTSTVCMPASFAPWASS